jgi:16S rRNA (guanine527-N7)-methyltransferase
VTPNPREYRGARNPREYRGATGGRSSAALLAEGISLLGLPDPPGVTRLLSAFLGELQRWNTRFGFVKAADESELVVKHVLDSLSAWRTVGAHAPAGAVLDVGSGAGFPGIPLAAALPDIAFTLLERSEKKASFLRNCAIILKLSNLSVSQSELSRVSGAFDVVTFRAVAPLERFLAQAAGSSLAFATIVAYKGRESRARDEVSRIPAAEAGQYSAEILPVTVPFLGEERCLVILRRGVRIGPDVDKRSRER